MLYLSWPDGSVSEMRVQFRRRSSDALNEMHKLFLILHTFLSKVHHVFLGTTDQITKVIKFVV